MKTHSCLLLTALAALTACASPAPPPAPAHPVEPPPRVAQAPAPAAEAPAPSAAPAALADPPPAAEAARKPLTIQYRQLVNTLSEKDAYYFSHNYVSNETAYLQVAPQLPKVVKPGGAFVGVGPEQNFSYVALTRPDIAFVVDIRRRNMLLHLLYKAVFEEATTRSHFLALLLGRTYEAEGDPGQGATIEQVIAHATRTPLAREKFAEIHERLMKRIQEGYGFDLPYPDRAAVKEAHKEFYDKQMEIRFELHMKSKRQYPSLQALLTTPDPAGQQSCFLCSEADFRLVQAMQKEDRIVPVVGDFAGDLAVPGIAAYLKEQGLRLSTFYVSNVEEYLIQDNKWPAWVRNVSAFPVDHDSVFIRSYLARAGRTHPLQREGHWSTVFLQRIQDFLDRERQSPFRVWHDVATHAVLAP